MIEQFLPFVFGSGLGAAIVVAYTKLKVKKMSVDEDQQKNLIVEVKEIRYELFELTKKYAALIEERAKAQIELMKAEYKIEQLEKKIKHLEENK